MIRPASSEDFFGAQRILAQLDRSFFRKNRIVMMSLEEASLTRQRFDEWLTGTCSVTGDTLAPFVAERDGALVAVMLLRLSAPPPAGLSRMFKPAKVLKIEELVVEESWRGKGYGTALLKVAQQKALEGGADRISVGTIGNQERAVRFYRRYFKADVEEYMFSKHLSVSHR
jgi:GNAT superfamily N-acetyltransferase